MGLMMMSAPGAGVCRHDHAMPEDKFEELFGVDVPVVMFFHGSPSTVRGLIYRRRSSSNQRFTVKGFIERLAEKTGEDPAATEYGPLMKELQQKLKDHAEYVWEHGEDMPEIKNWEWKDKGDLKTWKAEESEGQQGSIDSFHCEHGARNEN